MTEKITRIPPEVEIAQSLMNNDEFEKAIEILYPLPQSSHRDIIDYYLGLCFCKINKIEQGVASFSNSAHTNKSQYSCKSYVNLAAIYKRKNDQSSHQVAFAFLEKALLLAENLHLEIAKEQIYQKIARYIVDLDFFDQFDGLFLNIDWKKFRKELPSKIKLESNSLKEGLHSLILAHLYWHREKNLSRVQTHLAPTMNSFQTSFDMMIYIAQWQNQLINKTASIISQKEKEMPKAQQDLARLYEVGKAMNSTLDLDELLALIVDNVIDITHAERGFLMLADDGEILRFRIARNHKKDTLFQNDFLISKTLVERVVELREPILVANVENEDSWIFTDSVIGLQLKSLLCVPLTIDGRLLGVIYVDSSITRGKFGERELDILTTLASNAAIAIENASLYRNLEEKRRYLENLLISTKEMAISNDVLSAIALATHHIIEAIPPFGHTHPYLWLIDEEDKPTSYYWEKSAFYVSHEANDEPQFNEITDILLMDKKLHIPIWRGKIQVGILSFTNLPRENIRTEDFNFISGLMNSLSLALENLKREEEKQMTLVGLMASGIIHDLKNPITVLRGFADYALHFCNAEQLERRNNALKSIIKQADNMIYMVNDILDFAKGEIKLNLQRHLIEPYIQNTAANLESVLNKKNIQLHLQLNFRGEVKIDIDRFKRVILNLLKNAIEAIRKNGNIWITTDKINQNLLISIANDGPLIAPEVQRKLFKPFTTYGKTEGTGLGMAIVKRIIDKHNGEITFETSEYKTIFYIKIPQ